MVLMFFSHAPSPTSAVWQSPGGKFCLRLVCRTDKSDFGLRRLFLRLMRVRLLQLQRFGKHLSWQRMVQVWVVELLKVHGSGCTCVIVVLPLRRCLLLLPGCGHNQPSPSPFPHNVNQQPFFCSLGHPVQVDFVTAEIFVGLV